VHVYICVCVCVYSQRVRERVIYINNSDFLESKYKIERDHRFGGFDYKNLVPV
jgi:hypothetical protein